MPCSELISKCFSLKLMMVTEFISCGSVFETVSLFITGVLSLST